MTYPPSILRLRIRNGGSGFGLWIPVILVWPLLVLIGLLLSPLVIVLSAVLWPTGWGKPLLFFGPVIFALLCSLRGLKVDVNDSGEGVTLYFV